MTIDKPIRISPIQRRASASDPFSGCLASGQRAKHFGIFTLDPPSTWKNGEYAHDLSWFWIFASILAGTGGFGHFFDWPSPILRNPHFRHFPSILPPQQNVTAGPCVPWEFRPRPPRQRPEPAMPEKRPWTSGDAMGIVNWNNAILIQTWHSHTTYDGMIISNMNTAIW